MRRIKLDFLQFSFKQNYINQGMDVQYGTEVSRNTLNDIIKASEDAIRIRQICKSQLPSKCTQQASGLIIQNFHNALQLNQQQPLLEKKFHQIAGINSDNRTPMKLKLDKNPNQFTNQRLSFDSKSFRKSSAIKSRRDQFTASTNRKKIDAFNRTQDGSFVEQRPWTQTECRKKFCRTADSNPRVKYFELKQQKVNITVEEELKRKQLKQRRTIQKIQQQKVSNALIKLSYQRRALQQEFQAAKIGGDKQFSMNRNKPVNEIVSYETENGTVLTNRFKRPFRKTIENIINIEFEERTRERILRRKSQRQYEVEGSHKKKSDEQQAQRENFLIKNQAYNNSGRRQISLIPYVTINPGVSLSESTIQASISRARPSEQLSREKFFSSIENKTFRSFSKEGSPQRIDRQMMTIDVCQKNRASKTTLNNETKESLRRSILWAPKTSREGHRIKLEKEDFLKQLAD